MTPIPPSPRPAHLRTHREDLLAVVLLVALVAFAFAPVFGLGFVPLDDPLYVSGNVTVQRGLTLDGLRWAFSNVVTGNWHPLTWLSHMTDVELWGMNPRAQHGVNALLHLLNTVLLFAWLRRSTGRVGPSLVVAMLFGVHPLRVESVAWISERKDLLAGFFWFVALLFYERHARRPQGATLAAVAVSMALSLLSKPMAVTLPFVLLLLDVWPYRRYRERPTRWRDLLVEKIPLFALSAAGSAVAVLSQRGAGAVQSLQSLSVLERLAQACSAYVGYLVKILWPTHLAAFYPHPALVMDHTDFLIRSALAALVLGAISVAVWRGWRRVPALGVGWAWYLGVLVPVIGIVQVGNQAMADRYTYLPMVGLLIAATFWLAEVLPRRSRVGAFVGVCIVAVILVGLTRAQVRVWKDGRTLYEHALAVTDSNEQALAGLGVVMLQEGNEARARELLQQALRINPDLAVAHHGLGILEEQHGHPDAARRHLQRAIELKPSAPEPRTALGDLLRHQGDLDGAESAYRKALEVAPSYRPARAKLARLLRRTGRLDEARELVRSLLRDDPQDLDAHQELAWIDLGAGDFDGARRQFEFVLQRDPRRARAHYELARILMRQGELPAALSHLETARRLAPGVPEIQEQLEELQRRLDAQ